LKEDVAKGVKSFGDPYGKGIQERIRYQLRRAKSIEEKRRALINPRTERDFMKGGGGKTEKPTT